MKPDSPLTADEESPGYCETQVHYGYSCGIVAALRAQLEQAQRDFEEAKASSQEQYLELRELRPRLKKAEQEFDDLNSAVIEVQEWQANHGGGDTLTGDLIKGFEPIVWALEERVAALTEVLKEIRFRAEIMSTPSPDSGEYVLRDVFTDIAAWAGTVLLAGETSDV